MLVDRKFVTCHALLTGLFQSKDLHTNIKFIRFTNFFFFQKK